MKHTPRFRPGLSLIETLGVIVIIGAIAPMLAHLLATTSASHVSSAHMRDTTTEAAYAIDAASARLRVRLENPALTITKATSTEIAFSDATALALDNNDLVFADSVLPIGVLAADVESFEIRYYDSAGSELDVSDPGLDETTIARVTLLLTTNGLTHTNSLYREGTRSYMPRSHNGFWYEDFNNLNQGSTFDDGATAWSTDVSGTTSAIHGVDNKRYLVSKSSPLGAPITWMSETIDISNYEDVTLSLNTFGDGSLDDGGRYADWLEVTLVIDNSRHRVFYGGGFVPVDQHILSNPYVGDEAVIEIEANITGADEYYWWDNLELIPSLQRAGLVIFDNATIVSYDPDVQDGAGDLPTSHTVSDAGRTLKVEGNAWVAIPIDYQITEDTVIDFDFRTSEESEIHGLRLDTDLIDDGGNDQGQDVIVHGTETVNGAVRAPMITFYEASGDWQPFRVRPSVSAGFTLGKYTRLVFYADDDEDGDAISEFRNVRIYESPSL